MEHLAIKAGEGMKEPANWQSIAAPLHVRDCDVSIKDAVRLRMEPVFDEIHHLSPSKRC